MAALQQNITRGSACASLTMFMSLSKSISQKDNQKSYQWQAQALTKNPTNEFSTRFERYDTVQSS